MPRHFVSAGLGGGRVEMNRNAPREGAITSPVGSAFKVATGYDIGVTRALAVTPFASYVYVGGGTPSGFTQRMSGNVFLIGVQANLITRELVN